MLLDCIVCPWICNIKTNPVYVTNQERQKFPHIYNSLTTTQDGWLLPGQDGTRCIFCGPHGCCLDQETRPGICTCHPIMPRGKSELVIDIGCPSAHKLAQRLIAKDPEAINIVKTAAKVLFDNKELWYQLCRDFTDKYSVVLSIGDISNWL